jgi:hypothetical protein
MSFAIDLVSNIFVSHNGFMVHVSILSFKNFMTLSCLHSKHEFHLHSLSNFVMPFQNLLKFYFF